MYNVEQTQLCVWHGMAHSDILSARITKSQTMMGFHRPWHKVVNPWANAFNICFLCKASHGQGQLGWKLQAWDTRERIKKRRRAKWSEKSLGQQERAEDKYVKPTLRIRKWEIINQTSDIGGVWPLLNWSPVFNYTTGPSSITVREEITEPLNNYFFCRFVSFVSVSVLRSRETYPSCQCDTCSFVTQHDESPLVQWTALPSLQGEIKIYSIPTEWVTDVK